MGYVPKRKIYNLTFEGAEFDGLVVKAHSLSGGEFLDITERAQAAANDQKNTSETTRQLFEDFLPAVVEWNLEKPDGTPWPVSVETLLAQDFSFGMAIVNAWLQVIGGVPDPLVESSTGGASPVEASIPMDVPSLNPQS
jgi:hypothetical protein